MFRRAIEERSQVVWPYIVENYEALVSGWVNRHPAYADSGESVGYFVNGAFAKMWRALTSERFREFLNLQKLLNYLRMCVNSEILDHVRRKDKSAFSLDDDEISEFDRQQVPAEPDQTDDEWSKQELWLFLKPRLRSKKEEIVLYYTLFQDLKPRDIYDLYLELFEDVSEVHRIKQNIMSRLRRDSEVKEYLGQDD